MPEDMSEYMPEDMSDRMPEDMSEYMPEDMPDRMPEDMSDRVPEDMPDRMPEDLPDRMPEDMPDHMPEDVPDRMSNRMSEDMSDRMPEDLPVRKCINVMVGITRSKVILLIDCSSPKCFFESNHGCFSCQISLQFSDLPYIFPIWQWPQFPICCMHTSSTCFTHQSKENTGLLPPTPKKTKHCLND